MLAVETIDDVARFEALRDEWEELLNDSSSDCIFLSWEWLFTWWRCMAEDRRLRLILVRDSGRLIAIAPLALRPPRWKRLLPFPALEFLGSGCVGSDYLDLIIRRGEESRVLSALAGCLAGGAAVDFSQTRADGSRAAELARELESGGWEIRRTPTDLCPYIDLQGQTWDSYLSSLGPAHRYNLRRRLRNLQSKWRFSFELAVTEEQRAAGLREVIALHGLRWRSRGESGVFGNPDMVAFHEEFSRLALGRGWLRLYVLRLDGKAVAAWYGFNYRGVVSYYQGGFDPAFYKHSVGLVMMGLAIKAALDEQALAYDFLRGDESYKSLWTCRERELVRLDLFAPCLRGVFYRQWMELRWNIRKKMTRPGADGVPDEVPAPE
jgi:CelD/BcsL family acetyltransferase involved in cellulose biosynthesis